MKVIQPGLQSEPESKSEPGLRSEPTVRSVQGTERAWIVEGAWTKERAKSKERAEWSMMEAATRAHHQTVREDARLGQKWSASEVLSVIIPDIAGKYVHCVYVL